MAEGTIHHVPGRPTMTLVKRILVPTDFSDSAKQALDWGVALGQKFQAELVLLHVVENLTVGYASDLFPVPMAEVYEEITGYARAELTKLAEEARAHGVTVAEKLAQGTPSAEIIRLAKEESLDLIVVGSHGKGLLDHALFGSTTERVVRKAPCPVLTCRPPKPAEKR
jgi:nucleotide-binding universal stress UspA family protein